MSIGDCVKNTGKIRVCAFTLYPYDKAPHLRFRIEQWEPYLESEGIIVDYFPFADSALVNVLHKGGHLASKFKNLSLAYFRRFKHLFVSSKYDVVLIHRASMIGGPAIIERLLYLMKRPIIFDFDDAIFLTNTSNENKFFGWAKFAGKTKTICRLSSVVTTGNAWLAEYANRYNENTHVVPTSIDTNRYKPILKNGLKGRRIIVGWTGSSTSQYHLEEFEPVLQKLLRSRDVEIRVISNREPSFEKLPYVWREWLAETEVKEISEIDIGIMPNPDDEWSKGKCALKALQYMSVGVPAVCSDIGANREVIKHGKNGFLAKTTEDWLKYLKALIDDAEKRKTLGKAARESVVNSYSAEKCAKLFANAVRQTLSIRKVQNKRLF